MMLTILSNGSRLWQPADLDLLTASEPGLVPGQIYFRNGKRTGLWGIRPPPGTP